MRITHVLALLLLCLLFKASTAQEAGQSQGQNVDPTQQDSASEDQTNYWIYVHGILMSLGWVALLPREFRQTLQKALVSRCNSIGCTVPCPAGVAI